ncbi:MAG: hypothetical protein A7316_04035 [Candidatus Altiarchaeales archaeon WOR_SM1_86-2]|nr:MAG: hypothetical protein A7316_04035 [Candidatus Altiarchaeales archaeon WOR_SM1_86-2]ODS40024.1 MAG: hypothetical protein A7315_09965 [Candidatus Altiarchaeales archaeon WOR_SM1_79]
MKKQKIPGFELTVILFLSVVLISGCIGQPPEEEPPEVTPEEPQPGNGTVVFAVTDAAEDVGNVSSVNVTINKVLVHSVSEGWITVSDEEKTFDLLELKAEGAAELLASANLSNGTYNQIRIDVNKTVVVKDGVAIEAKLPSGELKIIIKLEVIEGEISAVTLDFIADESLHVTGDGKIIMAPVLKIETKTNTSIQIRERNRVEIKGGKVKGYITVGMNENGEVGEGVKIRKDAGLLIEKGKIKVLNVSSTQALNLAAGLNMITAGKVKQQGNEWVIKGIDAETGEHIQIRLNANNGAVVGNKTKFEGNICEANCKAQCEASELANCKANCTGNDTINCYAKAHANCESKCNSSLSAACEAGCKKDAKADCEEKCGQSTGGKGPGDTAGCKANCETESINSCNAECIAEGKASCTAECKSTAEAECKANANAACNKQCLLGEGFRNCYSECAAEC